MDQEEIIRNEAREFHEWHLKGDTPIGHFHEIKSRLRDFYSSEFKAIFLDDVQLAE